MRITDLCLIRTEKGDDWNERVKRFEQDASYRAQASQSFQARVDLAPYSYIDKEKQQLVIYQQKTRNIQRLPFSQRTDKNVPTIALCIENLLNHQAVNSTFLLKEPTTKENKPINPTKLSKTFTALVSQKLKLDWLNDKAPTFAELRPLGRNLLQEFEKELKSSQTKCNSNNKITTCSTIQEKVANSPIANNSSNILGHFNQVPMSAYLQVRDLTYQLSQDI